MWYIELMKELESDWKVRQGQEVEPLVVQTGMITTLVWRFTGWLTRLTLTAVARFTGDGA